MKKMIAVFLLTITFTLSAQEVSIRKILTESGKNILIPRITATLTVKLISANGDEREIRAKAYQKFVHNNQVNRLFLFEYPPSVRNSGLLIRSFLDGRENVMWIYLPAVKRIKRIALSKSGGGYFMGSDFSYSDFIAKADQDYIQELKSDTVLDGTPCYVIKEYGKTQKQRQELELSYMINYYRKSDYLFYGRDFYDLAGELVKRYRVKKAITLGDYVYPTVISMINVQTKHKSIIEMTSVSVKDIPDKYFTTRYLQNR